MWYETLLPRILNMSITGSIVIGILLLVRPLLKGNPRVFAYSLWAVVLFRLLCPVTLSAEVSLLQVLDLPVTEDASIAYIPEDIVSAPYPKVDLVVKEATDLVNEALPQGWEQVDSRPLAGWMAMATAIWLAGAGGMLCVSLCALAALRRRLAGAEEIEPGVWSAEHLQTPLVLGFFRPRVYLPAHLSEQEQVCVLTHEGCHIRRGDHIWKLLAFAALCIHWFNPLVWLAFFLFDRDMEISCDEAAVRDMDKSSRCDYSETLLRLATGKRAANIYSLCFAEGDPRGRIRHILKWRRPSRLQWNICCAICLLLCISLMTDPVVALDTEPDFSGRIQLELPQGYQYTLLRDPNFQNIRGNLVIYQADAEYPVAEGCISLDFTSTQSIPSHIKCTAIYQTNGTTTSFYGSLVEDVARVYCKTDYGTIEIIGHNSFRWDAQTCQDFQDIVYRLRVLGPEECQLVDLSQQTHMSCPAEVLEHYALWTDQGQMAVDLADMEGEVTVQLCDAYTGEVLDSFTTPDAAREDCCMFRGLSPRREYQLRLLGSCSGTVTVFTG